MIYILKLVIQVLEGIVENEYFCMWLVVCFKLLVFYVEICLDGVIVFFLVECYDWMKVVDGIIECLYQEDFCQVFSVLLELKYEVEGGFGIEWVFGLIDQVCVRFVVDCLQFICMLIFYYFVGNVDVYGKNYVLFYGFNELDLVLIYDVVCMVVYFCLLKRLVMKIGGCDVFDIIQLKYWMVLVFDIKFFQCIFVCDFVQMVERIVSEVDIFVIELVDEGIKYFILSVICKVILSWVGLLQRVMEQVF